MAIATASICVYSRHKNKSTEIPIQIRVSSAQERKYYATGIEMLYSAFLCPKSTIDKRKVDFIEKMLLKAKDVLFDLGNSFSFTRFEKLYLSNTSLRESLSGAFKAYIDDLSADQAGTKGNYQDAMNSFAKFDHNVRLADITPEWLKKYEKWATEKGNSPSTTGMYCRSLRAIINKEIRNGNIAKDLYPFGRGLYEIPTSRNIKKALTLEDIKSIMDYTPPAGTAFERDRDLWLLIYLCNGINTTDICHLKNSDLKGDSIEFMRQKTINTKKDKEAIYISLLPMASEIINKHRSTDRSPAAYLFPFFTDDMTPENKKDKVYIVYKAINKSMKKIAKELGINKEVTTYYARHSFATIMSQSGANILMISKMLGHRSIATTERYLAGFVKDDARKAISALMPK